MIDCKKAKLNEQMYELKIIQIKIDCHFDKKGDH